MTLHILETHSAEQSRRKSKVTCVTCKLKGCVGRCRWEATPKQNAN